MTYGAYAVQSLTGGANLTVYSGNLTVNGAYTHTGATLVEYGTLTLNGASSMQEFVLTGGTLNGSGAVTVTGPATLGYGTQAGTGTTTLQGMTALDSLTLDGGRALRNEGTVNWTDYGNIDLNGYGLDGHGTVVNAAGATWNDAGDYYHYLYAPNYGGADTGEGASFANQGTYAKTGGGTTDISAPFHNTGTVDVQSGTLIFAGVSESFANEGTLTVADGASLHTNGFTNSGTITGGGTIGGAIVNNGIVAPGTADSIGLLTLIGDFSQTVDGLLDFKVASSASYDVFNIDGDAGFGGTLKLENLGGYAPQVGDLLILALFSGNYLGGTFNLDTSAFAGVAFSVLYDSHDIALRVNGVSAVPIPAAVWLFGSALAGLGIIGRRSMPA